MATNDQRTIGGLIIITPTSLASHNRQVSDQSTYYLDIACKRASTLCLHQIMGLSHCVGNPWSRVYAHMVYVMNALCFCVLDSEWYVSL